jgi:hypothetical protein
MANIDYIIIGPGPSGLDVNATVLAVTGGAQTDGGWLHPADERAALRVIPDPEVPGGHVVQVHYAGDPISARHALARSVYAALVERTDWDLVLDSDDAEDVLASRIKTRR